MVLLGERPGRPNDPAMTNKLWALTRSCLEGNPQRRPEIVDVICQLQNALETRQDDTYAARYGTNGQSSCRLLFPSYPIPLSGLEKHIPGSGYVSSTVSTVKARESWDSIQCVQSVSTDTCASTHRTTLGPRNLLGRARVWLLNRGMTVGHEYNGCNSSSWLTKGGSSA